MFSVSSLRATMETPFHALVSLRGALPLNRAVGIGVTLLQDPWQNLPLPIWLLLPLPPQLPLPAELTPASRTASPAPGNLSHLVSE